MLISNTTLKHDNQSLQKQKSSPNTLSKRVSHIIIYHYNIIMDLKPMNYLLTNCCWKFVTFIKLSKKLSKFSFKLVKKVHLRPIWKSHKQYIVSHALFLHLSHPKTSFTLFGSIFFIYQQQTWLGISKSPLINVITTNTQCL